MDFLLGGAVMEREETEKSRYYPNEFNWWELQDPCEKCTQPLHLASGQDFPFCPNCSADRETAQRGRRVLFELKKRVAEAQMFPSDTPREEDPFGPFRHGMPL